MSYVRGIQSAVCATLCLLAVGNNAQAALFDRGGGLIYDSDRNITWYDYVYKGPTGSGASWFEAMAWASALNVGGITGWRLPSALSPDGIAYMNNPAVSAETGSEMGHLYVTELGNANNYPVQETPNAGPFTQLALFHTYWTSTTYSTYHAYYFDFSWFGGNQNADFKDFTNAQQVFPELTSPPWHNGEFAIAVHYGDVAAPVVTPIRIDIKPGSDPNNINLCSNGAVPVAILGSDTFDVSNVDTETLRFAGATVKVVGKKNPKAQCRVEDVNSDVYVDLVCPFVMADIAGIDGESTTATLEGALLDGTGIKGTDSVNIVKATCH